jgi:hypothetical protein
MLCQGKNEKKKKHTKNQIDKALASLDSLKMEGPSPCGHMTIGNIIIIFLIVQ